MDGCTRRRVFGLAGLAGLAASCADTAHTPRARRPLPVTAFHDDLGGVTDGPLGGRASASGHRWRATRADTDDAPVVHAGAIGPPPGHRPGRPDGTPAAGYATIGLGRPVRRVGAEFRWDPGPAASARSAIGIGAFTWPATGMRAGDRGRRGISSPMHVSLGPRSVQYAVFADSLADYTALSCDEAPRRDAIRLGEPMVCDGQTTYRVDVVRDGDRCRVTVNDETWTFTDRRIGAIAAPFPFFEYLSRPGGANLPRLMRVWAD